MSIVRVCLISLCLCFAVGVVAGPRAHAAPLAQEQFEAGMRLYEAGEYDRAFAAFQDSYRAAPQPGILVWMGHACLKQRQPRQALYFYERYLKEKRDLSADKRRTVEQAMEQARQLLEEAQRPPPPAPIPPAPAPETPPPPAARLTLAPPPAPAPAPVSERQPLYKKWWLWTGVGVLAAGVVVGGVFIARAAQPAPMPTSTDPCTSIPCYSLVVEP